MTLMSVPKTAIDKYHRAVFREHYIWFAGNICDMEAVAKPFGMQSLSYQHLGPSIFTPNSAHVSGAGSTIMNIGHVGGYAATELSALDLVLALVLVVLLIPASIILGFISLATASKAGTTTEFPNCL